MVTDLNHEPYSHRLYPMNLRIHECLVVLRDRIWFQMAINGVTVNDSSRQDQLAVALIKQLAGWIIHRATSHGLPSGNCHIASYDCQRVPIIKHC